MEKIINRYKRAAVLEVAAVSIIALFMLSVWMFDAFWLKQWIPGGQVSNPVTAFCFVVLSSSFFLITARQRMLRRLGFSFSCMILLLAGIKLSETFLNYVSGADLWLFPAKVATHNADGRPFYMVGNTAVGFVLVSLSLLFFHFRRKRSNKVSDALALTAFAFSGLSVLGYIYNSLQLFRVTASPPMAFPTGFSFHILSLAILSHRAAFGFFSLFTRPYAGSRIARLLIPLSVIIPVLLGVIRLYGEKLGYFSPGFGIAFFDIAIIIVFVTIIWNTTVYLNRSEKKLLREMREKERLNEAIKLLNRELEMKVALRTLELDRNEKLFRSMIENSIDIVSIIDRDNQLRYISPGVENVLGYTVEEMLGKSGHELLHPDSLSVSAIAGRDVKENPGVPRRITIQVRHRQGHFVWMEGTLINLMHDENVKGVISNFHEITERIQAEEERKNLENTLVQEKMDQQRRLMQATIAGQEKEKKLIGMELHDNINQILTSTKLYLDVAGHDATISRQMITKAAAQLKQAIDEIRKLSRALVPHGIEETGIRENIIQVIEGIRLSTNITFRLQFCDAALKQLSAEQQTALFRIVQEQLNNVVKHAAAEKVNLSILPNEGKLELLIEDNGIGFDLRQRGKGIGLSNIKTRAELLQGEMELRSARGKGCTLRIRFPVRAEEAV